MILNDRSRTENRIVQVPVTDPEGEAYRRAQEKVLNSASLKDKSALAQYFAQLETTKELELQSAKLNS